MGAMVGKLDEISRAIGGLEEATSGLKGAFSEHCADDDRRHRENLQALQTNSSAIVKLNETLATLVKSVESMAPIFAAYQQSRWKQAGMLSVGLGFLAFLTWLAQVAVGALTGWIHMAK